MAKINAKQKGNRNELFFSKLLSERFGKKFTRVPMSGGFSTFHKGTGVKESAMQDLSGDIIAPEGFKFSIEVKSRKEFNFWDLINNGNNEIDDWLKQSEEESFISGKLPLLIIKINNRKPFVLFKKDLLEGKLTYKDYTVLRFDYFLLLEDSFFFKGELCETVQQD